MAAPASCLSLAVAVARCGGCRWPARAQGGWGEWGESGRVKAHPPWRAVVGRRPRWSRSVGDATRRPPRGARGAASGAAMELCARDAARAAGAPPPAPVAGVVCPGDVLLGADEAASALRGHGTLSDAGAGLRSTVVGSCARTNNLVCVVPQRARYVPQVGDVCVGRVVSVGRGVWTLDVRSRLAATLALSAVELPGAAQRLRTANDELRMRDDLREGDVVVAEVQAATHDGGLQLHTRGQRYGSVGVGVMVDVPAGLVRRAKRHVAPASAEGASARGAAGLVVGTNGSVWCGDLPGEPPSGAAGAPDAHRCAAAVRALAKLELPIGVDAIDAALRVAASAGVATAEMGSEGYLDALLEAHEVPGT